MIDLFKPIKKTKSVREYRVECINKERGIICSLKYSPETQKYATCLVLGNRAVRTTHKTQWEAEALIAKYRNTYKG